MDCSAKDRLSCCREEARKEKIRGQNSANLYWKEIHNAAPKDIPIYWEALHLDRSRSDLVALLVV